jgi:hypothetical protein
MRFRGQVVVAGDNGPEAFPFDMPNLFFENIPWVPEPMSTGLATLAIAGILDLRRKTR